MADYKKMYFELMDVIEKAIEEFKEALLRAEDIYIETDDNDETPTEPQSSDPR